VAAQNELVGHEIPVSELKPRWPRPVDVARHPRSDAAGRIARGDEIAAPVDPRQRLADGHEIALIAAGLAGSISSGAST